MLAVCGEHLPVNICVRWVRPRCRDTETALPWIWRGFVNAAVIFMEAKTLEWKLLCRLLLKPDCHSFIEGLIWCILSISSTKESNVWNKTLATETRGKKDKEKLLIRNTEGFGNSLFYSVGPWWCCCGGHYICIPQPLWLDEFFFFSLQKFVGKKKNRPSFKLLSWKQK